MFGAPNQENQPIAIGRLIPIKICHAAMPPSLQHLRLATTGSLPYTQVFR